MTQENNAMTRPKGGQYRGKCSPALDVITRGGLLIYPTETLYALGADALNPAAVMRLAEVKGREPGKPLPLIIGSLEQLGLVTSQKHSDIFTLARSFWPGPLSVLVQARQELSGLLCDAGGYVALRVTSHPLARELCLQSGVPLVATSANPGGKPPAALPDQLDPDLAAAVDCVLTQKPWPAGGPPSTVVQITGPDRLRVLREGAVTRGALEGAGFTVHKVL